MNINNYFDKIVCINLERRKDRWAEMNKQFSKHGLEVIRINAVNGNPMGWTRGKDFPGNKDGALGCTASHVNVYKMAKENGWKSVLIIEDDCEFIDNLNSVFEKAISTLPEDWDLLYFGGTHRTKRGQFIPESINEYFVKGKRILTTHCYAVKDTMYDVILNRVLEKEPLFENTIDGYLAVSIQPICKTFAFHPPIAWQKAGHSDVQNGWRDYPHLKTGAFRG
jgi:GR25 family glycosyltransferase involved in LPS biosynthesis